MSQDGFIIKYDGGDADANTIDMRLLGESLQGIDRLVSDIVIVATARRIPKKGERAPIIVKAHEPKSGTVNIPALIQEGSGLLQLGWQVFGTTGTEIVKSWLKAVLMFHSGKKSEAEQAMQHIVDMASTFAQAMDRADERRHVEAIGLQGLLREQIERSGPSAVQTVAPVGSSVRRLLFFLGGSQKPALEVDEADAERIREKADLVWGPMETWELRTDGFVFHSRKLSVEHPSGAGYFLAEVDDPIAEAESNPYAVAVQQKATIRVHAKAAYRADRLERLIILNFLGVDDQRAA